MSSTPKRNQKLKSTLMLAAIVVGYSGIFVACGPSNKMKTLKQGSGAIEFTDEEKRAISEAQARAEEESGRPIIDDTAAVDEAASKNDDKADGITAIGMEGDDTTATTVAAKDDKKDKNETPAATSTTDAAAATVDGTTTNTSAEAPAASAEAKTAEVKANPDSQALMNMITDISLSKNGKKLKISYKNADGKQQTTTLVQNKSNASTTYAFKDGYFNKDLDSELKISATVSSIQSLSTLIVAIVAKPKSTSDGIPAIAIIKTQQIKLKNSALDTTNNSDDFISALKSTNLTAKRMLFAAEKSTDNQGTVTFALLDSAFNKIVITGRNNEDKKVLTLKSNFPIDKQTNISMVYPTTATLNNSVLQSNSNEFLKFKREIKDEQLQLFIAINPSQLDTSSLEANLPLLTIESLKLTVTRKTNDILTSAVVSAGSTTSVVLQFISDEEAKKQSELETADTKTEEAGTAANETATPQTAATALKTESKTKETPTVDSAAPAVDATTTSRKLTDEQKRAMTHSSSKPSINKPSISTHILDVKQWSKP